MRPTTARRALWATYVMATLVVMGLAALAARGHLHVAAFGGALVVQAAGIGVAALYWQPQRHWNLQAASEAVSLENLQIVPRYYLERLAPMGIFTVTALRRADPEWLAVGIGATQEMVLRWQARAELHLMDLRQEIVGWAPPPGEEEAEAAWVGLGRDNGAFGRGDVRS